MRQPEWGGVAMVRWGKGDWLYLVKKKRDLDSSFSDVDVTLKTMTRQKKNCTERSIPALEIRQGGHGFTHFLLCG